MNFSHFTWVDLTLFSFAILVFLFFVYFIFFQIKFVHLFESNGNIENNSNCSFKGLQSFLKYGIEDSDIPILKIRKMTMNIFSVVTLFQLLIFILINLLNDYSKEAGVLGIMFLYMLITYFNKKKVQKFYQTSFLISFPLIIFYFSSYCGMNSGLALYYILIISSIPLTFHNLRKRIYELVLILLLMSIQLFILFKTDFQLFHNSNIQEVFVDKLFLVTIIQFGFVSVTISMLIFKKDIAIESFINRIDLTNDLSLDDLTEEQIDRAKRELLKGSDSFNAKEKQLDDKEPRKKNTVVLSTYNDVQVVETKDVVRCETSDSYTTFFIKDGRKTMVSKSLKFYDLILTEELFYRVHQSHKVNILYIKK